ncbi:amidohydrolase family protein [Rhodoplanes sp. Z2-YC6860]|uniref:amidohydrolase family protein n=1 Tax=Rhodoplanes sp. Z2-YC6860 TaxID=674703 RepID=UPI00078C6245|nr:amidohydrolase family protein [Rhodoplanes sp. Z2-YC6860]AMN39104.1 cytosine deaminase [Rhodoplanes sp. Z2-YC6860]
MRELTCSHIQPSADAPAGGAHAIRIDGERIVAVEPVTPGARRLLAMPAPTNAHDHARVTSTTAYGGAGKPLESWIAYLALLPSIDPYLASAVSLSRSALGGAAAIMVHYTRVQGLTDLPTEVAEVARAARDVGVRVGFAVAMRNRNPLVYGPSEPVLAALSPQARTEVEKRYLKPPLSVEQQLALVDAVANAAANPMFDVQYGPQAVQWCTHELLEAIADASKRTGRRIHMHLLETQTQRAWLDANYPGGILKFLDGIGFLSPRLTLAHCTWARPDELELLAARGATISVNTSSNLHLRSGIAPLKEMVKRGCRVALGLDGSTFDEDDDALREMRLAHFLHQGWAFTTDVSRAQMLRMAFHNGRFSVTNRDDGGALAPGMPADILVLDWDAVDHERVRPDLNPQDMLFARSTMRHIHELIVAGRPVVRDGQVLNIDYPVMRDEMLARLRADMHGNEGLAAAISELERAIAAHYQSQPPCC